MEVRRVTKAVSRMLVSVLFVQALMQPMSMVVKAAPLPDPNKQYEMGFHVEEDTGMTILQSPNVPNYYQNNYWNTLDKNKIPGTTVLASDASNFVNGHILYVDGGILAYIGKQP